MTVEEIACLCSVSISTVSRALNGDPGVSAKTRKKINEAAWLNGYRKNTDSRVKGVIGVVVKGLSNMFFDAVVKSLRSAISSRGYFAAVNVISGAEDELVTADYLIRKRGVCGIIFLGGKSNYSQNDMKNIKVPYLFCCFTNRFGSLDPAAYSSVTSDDYMIGYDAAETFILAGHRHIGLLIPSKNDRSVSELRFCGFCAALTDFNIKYEPELTEETGDYEMASSYSGTLNLIRRSPELTALFTCSDAMAIAAIKAISDLNMSVPRDISIIGVDGIASSNYTVPTLSTIVQPSDEIGKKSVHILVDMIEKHSKSSHISIRTRLRTGKSIKYF